MSEPYDGLEPLEYTGPDQVFEFDVEIVPDQENIDAIIAWSKTKAESRDTKSAEENDADKKNRDDPDRPAA